MANPDLSFSLFVTIWNRFSGILTPCVHLDIANWLEERWAAGDDRMLLMAFRGCGKSTMIGLFIAWVLCVNPDLRVLIVSADEHLASRMVRHVRRVIERHPLTRNLVPEDPDQWAADRFTVKRSAEWRDPSVVSCGLFSNVTGMRADLIVCDDVEVPGTADTSGKRENLRSRLHELSYVQASGARQIYVGTPHAFDTIYATQPRRDLPGHVPFLAGFSSLKIPVMNSLGQSVWPEKYPMDRIERLRQTTGFSRFQSQMMLEPANPDDLYFDLTAVSVYEDDPAFIPELGQFYLGDRKLVAARAFWDPALARGSGDSSVLALIFVDEEGHLFVHRAAYLQVAAQDSRDDAAQQCAQVAKMLKAFQIPVVGVETNGIGRFLPSILRKEIVRARAGTAVIEAPSSTQKEKRILHAFEAPIAARMLHVHRAVLATPFWDELRDFRPGRTNRRDDGIDAAAGAIAMEPVRLPSAARTGFCPRAPWNGSRPLHARTT